MYMHTYNIALPVATPTAAADCEDADSLIRLAPDEPHITCAQMAQQHPFYCTMFADSCCASCRGVGMLTENPNLM